MMAEKCRKCRFWEPPSDDGLVDPGCSRITDEKIDLEDDQDAYVADYEGFSATFHPGPDFGCTLWEDGDDG